MKEGKSIDGSMGRAILISVLNTVRGLHGESGEGQQNLTRRGGLLGISKGRV